MTAFFHLLHAIFQLFAFSLIIFLKMYSISNADVKLTTVSLFTQGLQVFSCKTASICFFAAACST